MANFLFKTKGGSPPDRKPRVYFTSHPDDLGVHFERICEDIFKTHDAAIYYTESMTEPIEDEYKESDLGRMNLFVIPVTYRLLSQPSRAIDSDIPYARENNIPILPIMMEEGLDSLYSARECFGELQYLDPTAEDPSAISYEEKLKKHLESVLISDETAERIRRAFDAYIFLSYRKKDRHYANELMKMIHTYPEFRDIAIWYDEFLTPGESFRESIERMMRDSKLFTLLVTPNLLEYVNGRPNYVMEHEYPDAKRAGMDILPAEMEKTDKARLGECYKDIPECVSPSDDEAFRARLADTVARLAIKENDKDPEHNFLIGLAYLDGIDVETDRERGVALITGAAEAGLSEAMERLISMYREGIGVSRDLGMAAVWAERLYKHYAKHLGRTSRAALIALANLAYIYNDIGDYRTALKINKRVYALMKRHLFKRDPELRSAITNLALSYRYTGHYKKALKVSEEAYVSVYSAYAEDHPDTATALSSLANAHLDCGNYEKAIELQARVVELRRWRFGEEHPSVLRALSDIAVMYGFMGNYKREAELEERIYGLRQRISGEDHSSTAIALANLAFTYANLGEYERAHELHAKAYSLMCDIFGPEHPETLTTLSNFALTYGYLGNFSAERDIEEELITALGKRLGSSHPLCATVIANLARTYDELGEHSTALGLHKKAYSMRCSLLGDEHPDTLTALANMAITYGKLGKLSRELEIEERVYALKCKRIGEKHPETLRALSNLAVTYSETGDFKRAHELMYRAYRSMVRVLGGDHPDTVEAYTRSKEYGKRL